MALSTFFLLVSWISPPWEIELLKQYGGFQKIILYQLKVRQA